ncbi:MAG: hypothetical protein H6587_08850 [Flavobacteriales bacterium]|nr:hypothetical protein [Flavobacteriales bacterium]MCB9364663.1 hypothetical protein [Flavobacteriales bacterium]
MKIIKLLFLLIISFLISVNIFAQDEFYSESPKKNITSVNVDSASYFDENNIDNYTTERDYNIVQNNKNKTVIVDEKVMYKEEQKKQQRRNRAEFAAEVFFDVIVNAAFIVIAFWQ